jgi:hypothetical protein
MADPYLNYGHSNNYHQVSSQQPQQLNHHQHQSPASIVIPTTVTPHQYNQYPAQQSPVYVAVPNQQQPSQVQHHQQHHHPQPQSQHHHVQYAHPVLQTPQQPSPIQHHQHPPPATQSDPTLNSNLYLTLLGLADSFLKANQFRLVIHCLESILTVKSQDIVIATSLHIQLKTRLNLCRLYLKYTTNTNQYVNVHLEKSVIKILLVNRKFSK